MTRFASRYWSALTARDMVRPVRERHHDGHGFGRRYFAALFGIALPQRPTPRPRPARQPRSFAPRLRGALIPIAALGAALSIFVVAMNGGQQPTTPVGDGTMESQVDPPPIRTDAATGPQTVPTPPTPAPFQFDPVTEVPRCRDYTGKGITVDGSAAVLLVQAADEPELRFGAEVKFGDDGWLARHVTVGAPQDTGRYVLRVFAVPPGYVENTTVAPGDPLSLPSDAELSSATVTRIPAPGDC